VAAPYEHGNEPSVSIKCWEYLIKLSDYYIFNKDSVYGVWMDGWMDGRTDGRMDGWIKFPLEAFINSWV